MTGTSTEFRLDQGEGAVRRYLEALDIPNFAGIDANCKISFLNTGILNYAYSVEFQDRTIYLKQALKKAKKHDSIGADLASVPSERIAFEANFIQDLHQILVPTDRQFVPEILHFDRPNNILITADVSDGGVLLEQELLAGRICTEVSSSLGRLLGRIHQASTGSTHPVRETAGGDQENWILFLKMRTIGCLKNASPGDNVEAALRDLCREAEESHTQDVLLHIDYCPKNLFARPDGTASVIDFELGSGLGDPPYDLGFLMGHYLLQARGEGQLLPGAQDAVARMFQGYLDAMPLDSDGILRAQKYAGATILYRLYGSSRAPYINDSDVPDLTRCAEHLLLSKSAILTSSSEAL